MGVDAGTPPGLAERIRQIAATEVAKFMRSGFLRNASITDGFFTIKGGAFRLLSKATGGVEQFYLGPVGDVLGNGERQQFWRVRRADGTTVLRLWDAFPGADGTLNQALSWADRTGNVVFADDTDSGQGLARPWLSGGFARVRYGDMTVSTSAADWETLFEARVDKQQPRLMVGYRASMDADGATGETRVLVNDVQLGPTAAEAFVLATRFIGPEPVAGAHMDQLTVKIQARRTSATGGLRVEPIGWWGRQT